MELPRTSIQPTEFIPSLPVIRESAALEIQDLEHLEETKNRQQARIRKWSKMDLLPWGISLTLGIVCVLQMVAVSSNLRFYKDSSFHRFAFLALGAITMFCFGYSCSVDPGFVRKDWHKFFNGVNSEQDYLVPQMQFCETCETFKPPRAHHCSQCKRCVLRMDHHCLWTNNCIGFQNHRVFIQFLVSLMIFALWNIVRVCIYIADFSRQSLGGNEPSIRSEVFALVLIIILPCSFFALAMAYSQLKSQAWLISKNLTTIDYMQNHFTWSRLDFFNIPHNFIHPFHRDSIFSHIKESLHAPWPLWIIPLPNGSLDDFFVAYRYKHDKNSAEKLSELEAEAETVVNKKLKAAGLIS